MKQLVEERQGETASRCGHTPVLHAPPALPVQDVDGEIEGQRVRFAQHSLIFLEGDPADRIFQVVDGAVMLYKLLPDGRRQVVELLGPGDIFGLSFKPVYDSSAETLSPALVTSYERSAVERSPHFLARLNRCVQSQICALHEHAVLLGRKSALERVASFLMRFVPLHTCPTHQEREQMLATVRLTMTRQEIADYLGLTIETVSRAFSELRRRGVVSIEKQDEVKINHVCGICRLTGTH
ncbi:helix-turn-helix domain-containing protein [Blastochloris tepida]|jgi:CRP/FNR family transcriptional regulator|uniref:Nitrogen fixation regulation protein FixK n=1 Tax=Blastochloris tepida TaxID=2233851 RepID=A0A348FXP9_9HYPH|nr:helix-turn-helix domain-containing protein [Blastochloris tepida]BBF92082.1 nitrogen fixation regulation protein FixK [Blastochloris tepida]